MKEISGTKANRYLTKEQIHNRLHEHLEEVHTIHGTDQEVFFIALSGSQNYIEDKFSESSDVDSVLVTLPDKKDLFLGKDVSRPTVNLANGEQVTVFDIRKFLKILLKPGINNYEIIFTEYVVVNPKYQDLFQELQEMREEIARMNPKGFLMSLMGISKRDLTTLKKASSAGAQDVNSLGYSRKKLANILRFKACAEAYSKQEPFSKCLKSLDQNYLYSIRYEVLYTSEEAESLAIQADKQTKGIAEAERNTQENQQTKEKLEKLIVKVLDRWLFED